MEKKFTTTTLTLAFILIWIVPAALSQETVYNNFGPNHGGWDYNYGTGWTVAGENVASQYGVEQAMGFQSTASGTVSDIWVAMWYVPIDPGTDEVTLRLTENPSGLPPTPGDVMEEWTLTDFEDWSQWSDPIHLRGKGLSYLEAGKDYWLWAIGGDTTWCGWCMNINPSLTCPHTIRREGENWLSISNETASAFRVDIVPGRGLSVDRTTLPESTGGIVNFSLDGGLANANRSYFLLGSLSGIEPGLPLPGGMVNLPLNWDLLTELAIRLANSPALPNFHGTLDGSGLATAQLNTLGPIPPGTAGTELNFAFLLYYPSYYPYDFVSNPVELVIE